REIASVLPQPLDQVTPPPLGARFEVPKFRRAIVTRAQGVERTGLGALDADIRRLRFHAGERLGILPHEGFRPGDASQIGREPCLAEAHPALAVVSILVPRAVFGQPALRASHQCFSSILANACSHVVIVLAITSPFPSARIITSLPSWPSSNRATALPAA